MRIPTPGRVTRRFVTAGALAVADEVRPDLEEAGKDMAGRVIAVGAGALAALLTRKLVKMAWKAITGTDDVDPADPSTPWSVAIGWTVAIGVGASVGGLVGRRLAAEGYRKAVGSA